MVNRKMVKSEKYDHDYFLTDCDGADYWQKSLGNQLNPRLNYAWDLSKVKKGDKVLDFGCGRGEILLKAAKSGAQVFGVDYSLAAILLAKETLAKNKTKGEVLLLKEIKLPFKNDFFDVIFLLDVVEHLNFFQVKEVLTEIKRVLKKKGRLIIHTSPNKNRLDFGYKYFTRFSNFLPSKLIWEPLFKTCLNYQKNPRKDSEKELHINEQTPESLLFSLKENGFREIKIWTDSRFRRTTKGAWVQFTFLQPIWLPFLKKYFDLDIWAVTIKD